MATGWRWDDGCGCVQRCRRAGLIGLVILGEALLEPLGPARIEQKEVQITGGQVRVSGQMQEEGQPEVAGRFTGDIDPVEGVLVEGIQKKSFGQRVAWQGIDEGDVGFERLTVRKEQAEVRLLLTKVDANL